MHDFTNFTLVNKLFDNIIIFSKDNEVIFSGNKIKKILFPLWKEIRNLHSGNVQKPAGKLGHGQKRCPDVCLLPESPH